MAATEEPPHPERSSVGKETSPAEKVRPPQSGAPTAETAKTGELAETVKAEAGISAEAPPAAVVGETPGDEGGAEETAAEEAVVEEAVVATPPYLLVVAPADDSYYASSVELRGKVGNSQKESGSAGRITLLSWEIEGTGRRGDIEFGETGAFHQDISTAELTGSLVLTLTVRKDNGRAAERSIRLLDDGEGPSLRIRSPEDQETFDSTVEVIGEVRDAPNRSSSGEVKSVYWRVEGTSRSGKVDFGRFGDFRFAFSTIGLPKTFRLIVSAEDYNYHTSSESVTLHDDGRGPYLQVDAPVPDAYYGPIVDVRGRVSNTEEEIGDTSEVKSLGFAVEGDSRDLPGSATGGSEGVAESAAAFRKEDGAFAFRFPTKAFRGEITLVVKAMDLNGNPSALKIPLRKSPGPYIAVTSPADESFYRSYVSVVGRVSDAEDAPDSVQTVESMAYRVEGHDELSGKVEFDGKNGTFSFDFPTAGLTGSQTVEISAQNSDGHLTYYLLLLRDGNAVPLITIDSPKQNSTYGAMVTVKGSISLPHDSGPSVQATASAYYTVSSAETFALDAVQRSEITLKADGSFQFVFPAQELEGTQTLTVAAEAPNGNRAEVSVDLREGDSDIPSFEAVPEDSGVVLRWEPLPFAKSYRLYYTADGSIPSEANGLRVDAVDTPYRLDGLANGRLYCFVLRSESQLDMDDSWSGYEHVIPLSAESLAPTVTGEFGEIRIAWNRIPGADGYRVWRSTRSEGEYSLIRDSVSEAAFVDRDVSYGKTYYYRIEPSKHRSVGSRAVSGKTLPFPVDKMMVSGKLEEVAAYAVCVDGDYVYLAAGSRGVQIVDVSDPSQPTPVGVCETSDARGVVVREGYAYVADGGKGLKILDIAEPRQPAVVGMRNTSDAHAVALYESREGILLAFVADGEQGIKVLDVTDPRRPNRVSAHDTSFALGVAVAEGTDGPLACVADGEAGMQIVDMSRPSSPHLLGVFPSSDARAVRISNAQAFIADGMTGLKIVDISDPEEPRLIGSHDAQSAVDISFWRSEDRSLHIFLADGGGGLKVFDAGDPSRPALFGSLPMDDALAVALGRTSDGRLFAYTADSSGLVSMHVMLQGRSFPVASVETEGLAYSIKVGESPSGRPFAFVADHQGGMKIFDVGRPDALDAGSLAASAATDYARKIAVMDSSAFVADGKGGLKIFDVSSVWDGAANASLPQIDGFPALDVRSVSAARIDGRSLVFLADGADGLMVVDVGEAAKPRKIGSYPLEDVRDLAYMESPAGRPLLCAADCISGVVLMDVSVPEEPTVTASLPQMDARRISVFGSGSGRVLATVIDSAGLHVVDVSDPESPRALGSFPTQYAEGAALHETSDGRIYAFLAEGYRGFKLLEVDIPALDAESPALNVGTPPAEGEILPRNADAKPLRCVSAYREIYAVDVAARESDDGRLFALVADTAGIQVLEVLIPPWLQN